MIWPTNSLRKHAEKKVPNCNSHLPYGIMGSHCVIIHNPIEKKIELVELIVLYV